MFIWDYVETGWLSFKTILKVSSGNLSNFGYSSTSFSVNSKLSDDVKMIQVLFKVVVGNRASAVFDVVKSFSNVSSLSKKFISLCEVKSFYISHVYAENLTLSWALLFPKYIKI
jgi:hypothetical protein